MVTIVAKFGQCFSGSSEKNEAPSASTTSVSGQVSRIVRLIASGSGPIGRSSVVTCESVRAAVWDVVPLRSVGILPPVSSLIARPTETIVPARLGRSFRWLLAAAIVNNIGDGIVLAAGPLLVASQTSDPFLVSMAVLSGYLPTLLFGVLGGALADRFDRRRMVIVVDLVRAPALVVLVATIVTGDRQHRGRPDHAVRPRHRRDIR